LFKNFENFFHSIFKLDSEKTAADVIKEKREGINRVLEEASELATKYDLPPRMYINVPLIFKEDGKKIKRTSLKEELAAMSKAEFVHNHERDLTLKRFRTTALWIFFIFIWLFILVLFSLR